MEYGEAEGVSSGSPVRDEVAARTWYCIRMTEKDARRGAAERLVRDIYDTFRGLERDPAIAVLSSCVVDGFVEVFFSPAASSHAGAIIKYYGGRECPAPAPGARLLLGSVCLLE